MEPWDSKAQALSVNVVCPTKYWHAMSHAYARYMYIDDVLIHGPTDKTRKILGRLREKKVIANPEKEKTRSHRG